MTAGSIRIQGARQNNLQGVSVDIPRNRLVAITGVSGSGKSSLAFDTLFREGQRRFLETLSAYARQFLGRMEKPEVESIEGLSPAIAVDQQSQSRGPRSTVGTLTEIYDHLRVLFARAGTPHCPKCELPLKSQTSEGIAQQVLSELADQPVLVLAPLVRDRKGSYRALFEDLARRGFVRVRVDGTVQRVEEVGELSRYQRHKIEVVVDRLKPDAKNPSRLREALQQAVELGEGDVILADAAGNDRSFSTSRSCPGCGEETPPLEPRLFSFNSPHGACPTCEGLGVLRRPSEARVVRDPKLSIREGALAVTRKSGGALLYPKVEFRFLEQVARAHGFDLDTPWKDLGKSARKLLLHGAGEERYEDQASWSGQKYQGSVRWKRRFAGVLPAIAKAAAGGQRFAERFLAASTCPDCHGTRLRPAARAVKLGGSTLSELLSLPIRALRPRLDGLALTPREARIAQDLLAEIRRRIAFLEQVGLEYLTLSRSADTLSGGEAQRIRLAAQLGAGLQGVLYVLDEPSIGLHARDHGRLLGALMRLRDGGNTVVVVEHDEATLRAADHLIDVGPLAGRHGGRIVATGTPEEVSRADSPTGRLLRGELEMPAPQVRRAGNGRAITIRGARGFNLKDIDVRFPLGTFTVLSGVSGSGKSTLLNRILLPAALARLEREGPEPLEHRAVEGLEHIDELVEIDASPIGRTPRSNPATYTDTLGPIRDLFASLPEARMRGYGKSRFSFNVRGGRCEACGGAGAQLVELQFLAPVTVPCPECGGERFQAQTLEVRYAGKSIAGVLALTVDEALELFQDHPKIARPLETMQEVGLGYLTLGQPSTTLSGGEAQRIKLVAHLKKAPRNHTLYLLDEPTTGLHQHDVQRLLAALQRLVDAGHTVVVIEHNLDVLRAADHVIDLGPEGGAEGGRVVASGTPEELEAHPTSYTGVALREQRSSRSAGYRSHPSSPVGSLGLGDEASGPHEIRVRGARTHNLKNIDVSIPRDALTVITGPSGSGKSSLALDTIYTEGRRRFVESLSTYARQFLGTRDRPPVERIDGLGPSVAVEAGTSRGHPRSTVATTTEIHDHLRVLFSRAGTPRCPLHGEALERLDPAQVAQRIVDRLGGRSGWIVAPILAPDALDAQGTQSAQSASGTPATSADAEADSGEEADDPRAVLERGLEAWRTAGFVRILVDGVEYRLDQKLPKPVRGSRVDLVIDRLEFSTATRSRVAEAVEQAGTIASGRVSALAREQPAKRETKAPATRSKSGPRAAAGERLDFSTAGACPVCGFRLEHKLDPRHFSFNTHAGACPECDGLGHRVQCDPELLISHPQRSLEDGAISARFGRYLTKGKGYYEHLLRTVARHHRIDLGKPFGDLTAAQRALLVRGVGAKAVYHVQIEKSSERAQIEERFSAPWPGLCGHVDAWHAKAEDPEWAALLETVMSRAACATCQGERLRPEARAATVGEQRLPQVLALSVADSLAWLEGLGELASRTEAAATVIGELASRLSLLDRVGLGYLTLDRPTSTLSGGEARRVRLSASLGSQLVGVCYVLDEPTVGLHPADVERLTDALIELKDLGNTVLVVEHDEGLMLRADWIVDLGPGAGRLGGEVVASGPPAEILAHPTSLTGAALRGEIRLGSGERTPPPARRQTIALRGAKRNNLRGVDFEARFGALTGVCGPSGSGKSTLILDCLVPALEGERSEGRWQRLETPPGDRPRLVVIDASPIGRTPASIPATYTGLMEPLRELFARTPDARMRGFSASHFSFNSGRGRCAACEGRGAVKVEMQFLADLWLTCEECRGRRFTPEVLEVHLRGRSIADVLDLTVDEAAEFLAHQPQAAQILRTLQEVGLGYLTLGQSSTTLSGGEAQRIKLASELAQTSETSLSVLVLDEPTTGLHASDVAHLARVLERLADRGHAVIVIEHHTGLLALCDELVELGPAGGAAGGEVIASGTPAELAREPGSITGPFLARELPELGGTRAAQLRRGARPGAARRNPRKSLRRRERV
jgi:excinuclease ABC subunit A